MPSFDIVSKTDPQEIDNAINNANKEIATRFDFKTARANIAWDPAKSMISVEATSDHRVEGAVEVLYAKLVKRNVPLNALKNGQLRNAGGGMVKQDLTVQQGIEQDIAKRIIKDIKDAKLKVQGSIQADQVRVTGKSRDELQEAIVLLKGNDYGLPLQFVNFRD